MRPRHVIAALTLGALAGPALAAQERPDRREREARDWIERCGEDHGDDDRERHCEVRESRLQAGRTLAVDGRQNGGIEVEAWDGKDILVQARIQAVAPTLDEAREIAAGVRVDTAAPTISATGPSTSGSRHWWVSYVISVPREAAGETYNVKLAGDPL